MNSLPVNGGLFNAETAVLCAHALSTLVMVGVIWMVQLVHYPLFAKIPYTSFLGYERAHVKRITWIVAPIMATELVTAAWLMIRTPAGVDPILAYIGGGCVAMLWTLTVTMQGPTHSKLTKAKNADERDQLVAYLVRTNWLRTAIWSSRAVLSLAMLVQGVAGEVRGLN